MLITAVPTALSPSLPTGKGGREPGNVYLEQGMPHPDLVMIRNSPGCFNDEFLLKA